MKNTTIRFDKLRISTYVNSSFVNIYYSFIANCGYKYIGENKIICDECNVIIDIVDDWDIVKTRLIHKNNCLFKNICNSFNIESVYDKSAITCIDEYKLTYDEYINILNNMQFINFTIIRNVFEDYNDESCKKYKIADSFKNEVVFIDKNKYMQFFLDNAKLYELAFSMSMLLVKIYSDNIFIGNGHICSYKIDKNNDIYTIYVKTDVYVLLNNFNNIYIEFLSASLYEYDKKKVKCTSIIANKQTNIAVIIYESNEKEFCKKLNKYRKKFIKNVNNLSLYEKQLLMKNFIMVYFTEHDLIFFHSKYIEIYYSNKDYNNNFQYIKNEYPDFNNYYQGLKVNDDNKDAYSIDSIGAPMLYVSSNLYINIFSKTFNKNDINKTITLTRIKCDKLSFNKHAYLNATKFLETKFIPTPQISTITLELVNDDIFKYATYSNRLKSFNKLKQIAKDAAKHGFYENAGNIICFSCGLCIFEDNKYKIDNNCIEFLHLKYSRYTCLFLRKSIKYNNEKIIKKTKLNSFFKKVNKTNKCVICNDRNINMLFIPCAHYILCDKCCKLFFKCIYCKTKVENMIKTYI